VALLKEAVNMNCKKIPQLLKDRDIWCTWKYKSVDGRKTKVPYNPATGHLAKVNMPNSFKDYGTALKALENYDGLGIRVEGNIIAIDLDHCLKDGKLDQLGAEVVAHFKNTYIEISPSGTGLRIFVLMPEGFIYDRDTYYIKRGPVEVYAAGCTNRFVTVTGNVYQEKDISLEETGIKWLLETIMPRTTSVNQATVQPSHESYLSDDSVLAVASTAKNKEKFNKLWSGSTEGYASNSEADLALCTILAFYANGNANQVDRLFRKSNLMRAKWNEKHGTDTYGNITIAKAVISLKSFYSPVDTGDADEDFNDELHRLEKVNPIDNKTYPWTDIGAGKLFADYYKHILRYVPERRSWFFYSCGIWSQDTGNLKAMFYCMELAKLLHVFAIKIFNDDLRKQYMNYTRKWQTHGYRVNVLKDAQVYHPIPYALFDSDPYIFNCTNGTLHLDTGKFTEHQAADRLTKISPVAYDAKAQSERWDSFINEIMSGDIEKTKFLQKILGYALSGDTRHECMSILYGASTRNGKGTLCESVLKVFGGYGCTARPETIALKSNNNSSNPSEDIARLAGVRFVNIAEPGKGLILNTSQVKSMTGNDTLNARFLHENSFDFSPQFKLYINTNYLPVVNDITIFTSGRVIIIPFERHFDEAEQDKGLKHEFASPEVQSAILNWLIRGYEMLHKEGLVQPESVIKATKQYQHDSNKTLLFVEDCMEEGANYEDYTANVYDKYRIWCTDNGQYAESMRNFKQSLSSIMEVKRKRPRIGGEKTTMVIGYKLASDFLHR
jgi:putative DNA primase/helicase